MGYILLFLYNLITPLIAVFYLLFFLLSSRRKLLKNLFAELKERFALTSYPRLKDPVLIHAASVGEVKALSTLFSALKAKNPNTDIIITSSTASGRLAALKLTKFAYLLPLDFFPLMIKFIRKIKPQTILITETELWPNMLHAAGKLKVKVFLINARLSEKSFRLYSLASPLFKLILRNVKEVLCQSENDFKRYGLLLGNAKKITLTGNIKYDNIHFICEKAERISEYLLNNLKWRNVKIITAGSTWSGEDKILTDAYLFNKRTIKNLKFILAPRHPETADETERMLENAGVTYVRWSEKTKFKFGGDTDCVLLDELGWLNDFYYLSDLVFVGGTLVKVGGHNLLEPSLFSKPVLFGPNTANAEKAAQTLIKFGGGFMVKTKKDLSGRISFLIKNPALLESASKMSKKALDSLQGATEKTIERMRL